MKPLTTGQPGREPLLAANRMTSAAVSTVETTDEVLLHHHNASSTWGGSADSDPADSDPADQYHPEGSHSPQVGSDLPSSAFSDFNFWIADSHRWDSSHPYVQISYSLLEPTFPGRRAGSRSWGLRETLIEISHLSSSTLTGLRDPRCVRGGLTLAAGVLGLAGIWGAIQLLQQPQDQPIEMVLPSRQLLSAVLQQNYADKLEAASAALDAGELLTETDRPGIIRHQVEEGDTLWLLTRRYQVDAAAIAIPNRITAATALEPGQELLVPGQSGLIILVEPGDTLEGLANRYQVSQGEIIRATQLTNPNWLQVGQPVLIPGDLSALLRAGQGLPPLESAEDEEESDAAQPTTTPDLAEPQVYRIQSGDTLEAIARRYDISESGLVAANQPINPTLLQIGQELRIPVPVTDDSPVAADSGEDSPEATVPAPDQSPDAPIPLEESGTPQIYQIQPGDTIEVLARRYGVSEQAILQANQPLNPRLLQLGQEIQIPVSPDAEVAAGGVPEIASSARRVHQVSSGDTIERIAAIYGVTQAAIIQLNRLSNPGWLSIGQELEIPTTAVTLLDPTPTPSPTSTPVPSPTPPPEPVTTPTPTAEPTPEVATTPVPSPTSAPDV
ncbi:MAG: LysM peptidoglycan-binding domain-containing protein, partial [Synechococcaceae cyanobacterium SM2_3_2]|nr:LysM peptidoglycan-binding domain-containing protein [Synechococcaceae cyanobacterium SM2_3_2]